MAKERKTIDVPEGLIAVVEIMAKDYDANLVRAEASAVRGEATDTVMSATAAALGIIESLRGGANEDLIPWIGETVGMNVRDLAWMENATRAIEEVETLRTEKVAAEEQVAAAARAANPFPLKDDGSLDLESVPEAARSMVESAWTREQAAIVRATEAEEKVETQRAAKEADDNAAMEIEVRAFSDKITEAGIAGDKGKRTDILMRARKDDTLWADMVELYEAEMAGARATSPELGSAAPGAAPVVATTRAAASEQIEKLTRARMEEKSIDYATANGEIVTENVDLYRAYAAF